MSADTAAPEVRWFRIDNGAIYEIRTGADGVVSLTGQRTRTEYRSPQNAVELTGRFRNQPGVGWGARARITIDSGEGVRTYRGTASTDAPLGPAGRGRPARPLA